MNTSPKPAWMDSDLEQLADTANRFFDRECLPHDARWREQRHADRALWNQAGAAGLLCASIPEAYGGGGGHFGSRNKPGSGTRERCVREDDAILWRYVTCKNLGMTAANFTRARAQSRPCVSQNCELFHKQRQSRRHPLTPTTSI